MSLDRSTPFSRWPHLPDTAFTGAIDDIGAKIVINRLDPNALIEVSMSIPAGDVGDVGVAGDRVFAEMECIAGDLTAAGRRTGLPKKIAEDLVRELSVLVVFDAETHDDPTLETIIDIAADAATRLSAAARRG